MKIHSQNVKKAETPAFMKINDKIVNKKLEEQTMKLDEVVTMPAKLSLNNDSEDTVQAYQDQNNALQWQGHGQNRNSGGWQDHQGPLYRNPRGGSQGGYRNNNNNW